MAQTARVAFVGSFVLLNVYFAWDSRLLTAISPALFSIVNARIHWQIMALWRYFDLARFSSYAYIVADFENLALLIILVTSVAWLRRGRGFGAAVLRSTQVAALCLATFGVELALLDCPEFPSNIPRLPALVLALLVVTAPSNARVERNDEILTGKEARRTS